jgi:hypothetical protein
MKVRSGNDISGGHGGARSGAGRKPGVRNKLTREANATMTELCQGYTTEMIERLVSISRGEFEPKQGQVRAIEAILDRGHGKPVQSHKVGGKGEGPIQGKIEIVLVDPEPRKK